MQKAESLSKKEEKRQAGLDREAQAIVEKLDGKQILITARVGRPLIALNESRYTQEASFCFSIVRVSESSESVAFYSGEADERGFGR